jgi:hypothetical protein
MHDLWWEEEWEKNSTQLRQIQVPSKGACLCGRKAHRPWSRMWQSVTALLSGRATTELRDLSCQVSSQPGHTCLPAHAVQGSARRSSPFCLTRLADLLSIHDGGSRYQCELQTRLRYQILVEGEIVLRMPVSMNNTVVDTALAGSRACLTECTIPCISHHSAQIMASHWTRIPIDDAKQKTY